MTGNPVISYLVDTAFLRFEEVWQDNFESDLGTMPAESVTGAIQVHKENPDKRLMVHCLQPHFSSFRSQNSGSRNLREWTISG